MRKFTIIFQPVIITGVEELNTIDGVENCFKHEIEAIDKEDAYKFARQLASQWNCKVIKISTNTL